MAAGLRRDGLPSLPEVDARLSIVTSDEEVPLVSGQRWVNHDEAGNAYPHVGWDCPHYGRFHATDVPPGDEPTSLWFCAFGKGIALVDENGTP